MDGHAGYVPVCAFVRPHARRSALAWGCASPACVREWVATDCNGFQFAVEADQAAAMKENAAIAPHCTARDGKRERSVASGNAQCTRAASKAAQQAGEAMPSAAGTRSGLIERQGSDRLIKRQGSRSAHKASGLKIGS